MRLKRYYMHVRRKRVERVAAVTIDDLIAYGANVDEGLSRCMGNEGFYLRLVESLKGEQGFDALKAALDAGNLREAFETAHALKGVLGNLSITPLYEPVSELTEYLRAETQMDYAPLIDAILQERDRFVAL